MQVGLYLVAGAAAAAAIRAVVHAGCIYLASSSPKFRQADMSGKGGDQQSIVDNRICCATQQNGATDGAEHGKDVSLLPALCQPPAAEMQCLLEDC